MNPLQRRAGTILMSLLGTFALLAVLYAEGFPVSSGFDPPAATVGNARQLLLALGQYEQDSDERLPPTDTEAHFQAALLPFLQNSYTGNASDFFISKVTGQPFIPNPALSEQTVYLLGDPSKVAVFQDTVPPSTVPATVAFLDGYVERGGVLQGDPIRSSLLNARYLSSAVVQYTQDYDQKLPPTDTPAHFQAALLTSYVPTSRLFVDPLNGKPFVPNPAVSGAVLSTIADPAHTVLFQSVKPYYKDGLLTVGYVDGHATHGNVSLIDTNAGGVLDENNLKQISFALLFYTQDNNEQTPSAKDYSTFEADLMPYYSLSPQTLVQPDTGLPYIYNPDISGRSLSSFPDPASTVVLQDPTLNNDGVFNTLSLDGRVNSQYSFVPRRIALGPNDQTYLLWTLATYAPNGPEIALWTLNPSGGTLTQATYPIAASAASTLSVGGDGKARTAGYILSPDGSYTSAASHGPYDGWTLQQIASDAGGNSRLLWRRYDGQYALWNASPGGQYQGDIRYQFGYSAVAKGLGLGKGGDTRVLLKEGGTLSRLLTLAPSGQTLQTYTAQAHKGFAVSALALGADDAPRLLFTDGDGYGEVWTLTPDGGRRGVAGFRLSPGFSASSLAVGQAGDLRVLWTGPNAVARLQTLTAGGAVVSVHEFDPYQQ